MPGDRGYIPLLRLGSGGMSDVYFGVLRGAEGFQRAVVLKRALSEELTGMAGGREALAFEAHVGAALAHPNIVHIYELLDAPEGLMLAMEYLPGVSVATLMRRLVTQQARPPWPIAARIVADAARGLDHAHHARGVDNEPLGVVHRDVSPGNLLVTDDGITKVLDFGIARHAMREVTKETVVKGTPGYLAPEQVYAHPLDWRADVFSLGVVLHELLSGRPLFHRQDLRETFHAIVAAPIGRPPSDVPDDVADVVQLMLARDRDHRRVTMGEVADRLEIAATGRGGSHRDVAALLRAELGERLDRRSSNVRKLLSGVVPRASRAGAGVDGSTMFLIESSLDELILGDAGERAPANADDVTAVDPVGPTDPGWRRR